MNNIITRGLGWLQRIVTQGYGYLTGGGPLSADAQTAEANGETNSATVIGPAHAVSAQTAEANATAGPQTAALDLLAPATTADANIEALFDAANVGVAWFIAADTAEANCSSTDAVIWIASGTPLYVACNSAQAKARADSAAAVIELPPLTTLYTQIQRISIFAAFKPLTIFSGPYPRITTLQNVAPITVLSM